MKKIKNNEPGAKSAAGFNLEKYKKSKFNSTVKFKEQRWIPLAQAFQDVTSVPGIPMGHVSLLRGHSDTGKAQPLYSKIYTPDGFKFMGDIKVGDKVIGKDGSPKEVLGVYPQGKKDLYRVNFSDGFSVECCGDHLWNVKTIKNRVSEHWHNVKKYKKLGSTTTDVNKLDQWETYTTKQLLDNSIWIEYGKTKLCRAPNYKMPICDPVQFNKKQLFLDPYLLGVLIGDGCIITDVNFTSVDQFIIDKISNIVNTKYNELSVKRISNTISFNITGSTGNSPNYIRRWIKENKLNVTSELKFIPKDYLYSSIGDRIHILNGLMDTDGTLDKNGHHIYYSTTSKQLAYDVAELVQSLGCIASISFRENKFKGCYKVVINQNNKFDIFSLPRKQILVKPKTEYKTLRTIYSIDYLGETEQQCIYIDSEDHLYLTDNFTVTHNTTALLECAVSCQKMNILPVFIITEMKFNWEHAREMGLKYDYVTNDEGEIIDYEGFFIYVDRTQMTTIEDVAAFINDLLDEQAKGELPYDLCFLWDSIGSVTCQKSLDSKTNNNMWNAGAMSTQFSNGVNQKIPMSRKEGSPYTNTLVCVNKVWADNMSGGPMSQPKMMNKAGFAMWYDATFIVTFGNISNSGTNKIKATKGGKDYEFAKRTKINLEKNHINGVSSKGAIVMTSHGFIADDKNAIDQYKKDYSKNWLKLLDAEDESELEIVIEDEENTTEIDTEE